MKYGKLLIIIKSSKSRTNEIKLIFKLIKNYIIYYIFSSNTK